jgi:hypothetical protein
MDQFPKWHFGWIVHKIFCILIITPHDISHPTHQICFKLQSCGILLGQSSKGICSSWFIVNKKQFLGNPPTHFFYVGGILLLCKAMQWWCHFLQAFGFTLNTHAYHTTSSLSTWKCNIMLSFDKSLCKILQWCTTFIMFMNAHVNFTQFCLKVTSCVHHSISGSPCCNKVQLSTMGEYFML